MFFFYPYMSAKIDDKNIKINYEKSNSISNNKIDKNLKNINKKIKKSSKFSKIYTISKILSIVFFVMLIIYMFKARENIINTSPKIEIQNGRTKFIFESADNFSDIEYFTKEKLLNMLVQKLQKIVDIYRNGSHKDKLNRISATQRNFFLYGPPGTGKTHFVKKLAFVLDFNLKLNEILNCVGNKKFNLLKNNAGDLFNIINSIKSKVRIIFITPSMIHNKYIGESEAQVRELFNLANKRTTYDVTLIFFDEMDSFFADRDAKGQENFINVKTEFLNCVTSIIEKDDGLVICIGATNRVDKLDGAFRRRFGEGYSFDLPSDDELTELLRKSVKNWIKIDNFDVYLNQIKNILKSSKISQSNIIDVIKKTNFDTNNNDPIIYKNLVSNFQDFVNRNKKGKSYVPILAKNTEDHIHYNLSEPRKIKKKFLFYN